MADISDFWKDLGYSETPPSDPTLLLGAKEGELVIGPKNRVLVRIDKDGKLTYGEGYQPDLAAQVFWQAMATQRLQAMGADVQGLFRCMQDVLITYGMTLMTVDSAGAPSALERVQRLALGLAQAALATEEESP